MNNQLVSTIHSTREYQQLDLPSKQKVDGILVKSTIFQKDNTARYLIDKTYNTLYMSEPFPLVTFPKIDILNKNINGKDWGLDIWTILLLKEEIVITRPIKELMSHVRHLKLPRFKLIGRVIKTLVLSIFRWHLCDKCLFKVGDIIIHSLERRLSKAQKKDFQSMYPFMLENAYVLTLKADIKKIEETEFNSSQVNADTIREFFKSCYQIDLTGKLQGNSINDLFKSKLLDIKKP
ncbi:MAG: hypothetical protein H0W88_06095 [Parachlamydiaceae bacterium]|nr:hypothetical protein [Parachlamydiaceae bacterium]